MHLDFFSGRDPLLERADAERVMKRKLPKAKNSGHRLDVFAEAAFYGVPLGQMETAKSLLGRTSPRIQNDLRQYVVEAAESGIPAAQMLLAECYERGVLFPKNPILAQHLRQMAEKS